MPGKVGPSSRRKGGRTSKPVRVKRSVKLIPRHELIAGRQQCMVEIAHLWSDAMGSRNFLEKARQLLTKHWSASSWSFRGDILRSAEWLIAAARKSIRARHSVDS